MTDLSPTTLTLPADLLAAAILGVDYGAARIGLALKPAGQDWAVPRGEIRVRTDAQAAEALRNTIAETRATIVVVGLPLHADPTQAHAVRRFCRRTRDRMTGVRWQFIDEALTSQAAEAMVREAGPQRRERGGADAVAALLILETYLQQARITAPASPSTEPPPPASATPEA